LTHARGIIGVEGSAAARCEAARRLLEPRWIAAGKDDVRRGQVTESGIRFGHPESGKGVPALTLEGTALSKELKRRITLRRPDGGLRADPGMRPGQRPPRRRHAVGDS